MSDFIVSNHAKERYVERIKDKDERSTIAVYVAQNEEKIVTDINKMLEYSKLIYSGPSQNNPKQTIDVYLNGLWTILVDHQKKNVITLYSLDLGIDDETNEIVAGKLKNQIDVANEELQKVKDTVNEQKVDCQATIQENEGLILNYKKLIQDLEKQNEALRALVISLNAQINVADNNVRELVYKLISKKTF